MKLGTETGSLMTHVMTDREQIQPEVGMGATTCGWTDRHAGTIIKVTPCQIHVRQDKAIRIDTNGMSDCQSYRYEPDPEGKVRIYRKTKRGWRSNSDQTGLIIGTRAEYYDYSF